MAIYSGKPVILQRPVAEIYTKVSDLGQYRSMIDSIPEEHRRKLAGVEFRDDCVKMDAPGVGELVFKIVERVPDKKVVLNAEGCPIPLHLVLDMASSGDSVTTLTPRVDIQIPPMLKPFLGNKIQQAADQFGDVFTSLFA